MSPLTRRNQIAITLECVGPALPPGFVIIEKDGRAVFEGHVNGQPCAQVGLAHLPTRRKFIVPFFPEEFRHLSTEDSIKLVPKKIMAAVQQLSIHRCECSVEQYRNNFDGSRETRIVGKPTCLKCRGKGGQVQTCEKCSGTGMTPAPQPDVCGNCWGTGKVPA